MKINYKSLIISGVLVLVLFLVLFLEIGIFISGPKQAYLNEKENQISEVQKLHPSIKNINIHIFKYQVFIGESEDSYHWFDMNGKELMSRKKETFSFDKVKQIMYDTYQISTFTYEIGYGYESAAINVKFEGGEALLDYDTLETIFYRKEEV